MDLFLTILNHGGAIVLLIAIFGVEVASFVLHEEKLLTRARLLQDRRGVACANGWALSTPAGSA